METRNTSSSRTPLSSAGESHSLLQSITLSHALAALLVYFGASIVYSAFTKPKLPASIPWVGKDGDSWFAGIKGQLQSITKIRAWLDEGYQKYNKSGRSFVLQNGPGLVSEIVLPKSQLNWLVSEPDNVLSITAAHYDVLQAEYSLLEPSIVKDPYHEHVVYRNLTRHLADLIPGIEEEASLALDDFLGKDTDQWKKINLWDMLLYIIPRITNRMLVGPHVCREPEFLANMVGFSDSVVRTMLVCSLSPNIIRPIVGPALGYFGRLNWKRTMKTSMPIIQDRLRSFERKAAGDPEYKDWEPPMDYITWHITTAIADKRADELTARRISQRIMPLNFASIHTTAMTTHGLFLDILYSDPSAGFIEGLQEECARVWSEEGCKATKNGLSRMYRVDSAIRESMRISPIGQTIASRKVVAPGGVTNQAEGWHAPYGTMITAPAGPIHHDTDIHPNPEYYDAFRHSRLREEYDRKPEAEKSTEETLKMKQLSMLTTNEDHFPWGHGRHACPGRFFVALELKIIFAHVLNNYDLRPVGERPPTAWVGQTKLPAVKACMEVKRRLGTAKAL